MRKYLFRGKNKYDQWVEGDLVHGVSKYKDKMYIRIKDSSSATGTTEIEVDPKTVGQYINEKDKNRKKAFEGDIVRKTNDGRHPKIFTASMHTCFPTHEEVYYGPFEHFTEPCEYEIIGNIYDNPELLKGEGK